jgi:hypothetical protein
MLAMPYSFTLPADFDMWRDDSDDSWCRSCETKTDNPSALPTAFGRDTTQTVGVRFLAARLARR